MFSNSSAVCWLHDPCSCAAFIRLARVVPYSCSCWQALCKKKVDIYNDCFKAFLLRPAFIVRFTSLWHGFRHIHRYAMKVESHMRSSKAKGYTCILTRLIRLLSRCEFDALPLVATNRYKGLLFHRCYARTRDPRSWLVRLFSVSVCRYDGGAQS